MKKSATKHLFIKVVMLALFIGLFFIFYKSLNNELSKAPDAKPFYQYILGSKFNYDSTSNVKFNDNQVYYEDSRGVANLDSTPLYYIDEQSFMIPYDISAVYFDSPGVFIQEKLNHFTVFNKAIEGYDYQMDLNKGNVKDAFLFDGKTVYIVLNKAHYVIDGVRYPLSEMSFVEYDVFRKMMTVYDYEKDKLEIFNDVYSAGIDIDSLGISIDLINNSVSKNVNGGVARKLLLSNLDLLEMYEN